MPPMEDVRSQQSGENPDVVFCYSSGINISGSANPADLATRDSSVPTLNDAVPEERYCTLQSIIVPNHLPDDHSNILSVGGRLRHANLAYGHKHPILLPKRHILTDLIIRHYHEILLHAGTQLVQSCILEQYWIIGARDVIRHLIRKCVKCCKVKASVTNQMMSDLPSSRISPAPAFMRCEVDYAGPFQIKAIKATAGESETFSSNKFSYYKKQVFWDHFKGDHTHYHKSLLNVYAFKKQQGHDRTGRRFRRLGQNDVSRHCACVLKPSLLTTSRLKNSIISYGERYDNAM
ncbi:integrase catalytic domain-containing protein [Trichonephila clavata]|uniref:Integrase catalytic domain-containing protein n=1 Tax=Trichonephila clavata TaxID=2740835 RepID=A0A8X6FT10_TRICU|nr:integrase catalytic domain-containing protein [Trichonephila clavata]